MAEFSNQYDGKSIDDSLDFEDNNFIEMTDEEFLSFMSQNYPKHPLVLGKVKLNKRVLKDLDDLAIDLD